MTRNKILWFILWILSLVGISFYGGAVSYGAFFSLTLLPVISYLYLIFVFFHFKIYQETASRDMVCMQPMPYFFVLKNECWFGFAGIKIKMFSDFSYIESMPEDKEYELLPGDEFRYDTKIICKYRGEYNIGVQEVILTDFLRLFHLRYKVAETIQAIVHPRIPEPEYISHLPQMFASLPQNTSLEKREPDVIVRDYVAGDSLKKIHWKLSAREQLFKVRPDIDEGKQNVSIFLDNKRYSRKLEYYLPLENRQLETLLALSLYFAKKNITVSTYYKDQSLQQKTIPNLQSFEDFYTQISAISFLPEADSFFAVEECHRNGYFLDTKLFIGIFHTLNDSLLQLAEEIALQGTQVIFYVITEENPDKYQQENTSRKKIIVLPIFAETEVLL